MTEVKTEVADVATPPDTNVEVSKTHNVENVEPEVEVEAETEKVEEKKKTANAATLSEFFSEAESFDYLLMFLGTVGAVCTGVVMPVFNVLFGEMLDSLNEGDFEDAINELCIIMVGLGGGNLLFGYAQVYCWTLTGERQTQRLRERYVNAILSQEIGWFDTCGANQLSTRVTEVIGKVQDGSGRKFGDVLQYLSQFIAAMGVAFYLNWEITLVLLCAVPFIGIAAAYMINAISAAQNQALEQYAGAGGVATESLYAIRTITALNIQPDVVNRFRKYLLDALDVGMMKGFNVGLGNGLTTGAAFLSYALGFWYGGKLVVDSRRDNCTKNCITGGEVLATFFSTVMGSMALGQMAPPLVAFSDARAAVYAIMQITKRKPLIDGFSTEGEKPQSRLTGSVTFNDVRFCYPSRPNLEICKGYNLTIEPGETVALVGPSGCGKSTIINLLLRFYDPNSGAIRLDDYNIKDLNIKWLRSQIGYVGQEPILLPGTIAENISHGLDLDLENNKLTDALLERIHEAARQANAYDFISDFPAGFETDVGANGVSISGGQKQRIAIARALIKKPSILLLDEATSALDATSERVVQESIDKLAESKAQTTIIIAHRLSTIRRADKICVIRDGVIVEMGRHDDLVKIPGGVYADLIKLQMGEDNDDDKKDEEEKNKSVSGNEDDVEFGPDGTVSTRKPDNVASSKKIELTKEEADRTWRTMMSYIWKFKAHLSLGMVGAMIFGAIFPAWGYMIARTQDMFYLEDNDEIMERAEMYAGIYCMLAVVSCAACIAEYYGIVAVGENVSTLLRSELFESLMHQPMEFYDMEENSVGTLTTRLADDTRIINKAFGESMAKLVQAVFCLVIALALGFSASWQVSLVLLGAMPLNIAASAIQMQSVQGQQYDDTTDVSGDDKSEGVARGGHGALISLAFTNMRTISAFSMQHKISEQYAVITRSICDKRLKKAQVMGLGFGAANAILFFIYALLFWFGSQMISDGHIDFLDMMTSIMCLMFGALGLGAALTDMGDQKAASGIAARIFAQIESGRQSKIDGLSLSKGIIHPAEYRAKGRVELKNVTFRYPTRPEAKVCQNYNLVIEAGETVALVGPSGSGKSTIINLLLRFYDPNHGDILLDGEPITDLNVRWLRSQIGYVGQEPVLFEGDVQENIERGRSTNIHQPLKTLEEAMEERLQQQQAEKEAKKNGHLPLRQSESAPEQVGDIEMQTAVDLPEDVFEAAKAANAHDFIVKFTKGYQTNIGQKSIMVSGGQKQRIAIARALIKKPSILLLDEATSALDAASERVVQESIDKLAESKAQTTIIIAHRLTTIRGADKICVIDKGEIVEMGRHDDLLNIPGGLYKQLWEKQSGTAH